MLELDAYLDAYFSDAFIGQEIDFDYFTLRDIFKLNIALRKIDHFFEPNEKYGMFFELNALGFVQLGSISVATVEEVQDLIKQYNYEQDIPRWANDDTAIQVLKNMMLDRLAHRMTDLLGSRQIQIEQLPGTNPTIFRTDAEKASKLYANLRERIAHVADFGWLGDDDIVSYFQEKSDALYRNTSRWDASDFEKSIKKFHNASHVIRAAIKNRSEEDRASFRDWIETASSKLAFAKVPRKTPNVRIARGELRGFLKSLTLSGGVASDSSGGFLEAAVHGSFRFQSKLNMARNSNFVFGYGLTFMIPCIVVASRVSDLWPATLITAMGGSGLVSQNRKTALTNMSQNLLPNRPNAVSLIDAYGATYQKCVSFEVVGDEGDVESIPTQIFFPDATQQKEIASLRQEIDRFEDVVIDPSTISPVLPKSYDEIRRVDLAGTILPR